MLYDGNEADLYVNYVVYSRNVFDGNWPLLIPDNASDCVS